MPYVKSGPLSKRETSLGLFHGSFSVSRYRVLGRKTRLTVSELNSSFHAYMAQPLAIQGQYRELGYGWVLPDNPELEDREPDSAWDISDCLYEEGILLRLRIERRSVPAALLQELVRQRLAAAKKWQNDSEEPERVMRKQILDEVKEDLLRQSLPAIQFVEAFWKDQDDCIYLFSQSKMAREAFEDLFHKSFGQAHNLSLFRLLPPLLGVEIDSQSASPTLIDTIKKTLPISSQSRENREM